MSGIQVSAQKRGGVGVCVCVCVCVGGGDRQVPFTATESPL